MESRNLIQLAPVNHPGLTAQLQIIRNNRARIGKTTNRMRYHDNALHAGRLVLLGVRTFPTAHLFLCSMIETHQFAMFFFCRVSAVHRRTTLKV